MKEKEIKAILTNENDVNGLINLEPLRGANGYSAYELYIKNLSGEETPLSEKEWLDSLSKANYYKQYKSTYVLRRDNETIIPIDVEIYNSTCILDVYVEGFRYKEDIDYIINNDNTITVSNPLKKGTTIHFICSKTVTITSNDFGLLKGEKGDDGLGVPNGGATGQILAKKSDSDNDTEWISYKSSDGVIIGAVFLWFANEIPSKYLELNGQEVLRSTYSDLFNLFGTIYGNGDGSTTFNLPNLSGMVPIGLNPNDSDFDELGKSLGEKTHTLTINEIPKHPHRQLYTNTKSSGSWGRTINASYELISNDYSSFNGIFTDETGGDAPHNNIQPSIVARYIIKAQR